MPSEQQLSGVLSEFARTMVTDFPIQEILDRLVLRIVDVLPVAAAGVTLIVPGAVPRYVAASNEFAMLFEQMQTDLGEGPCVVAYETGSAVAVPDLRSEGRFPRFGPKALARGLVAVFTFPLRDGDERLGALDLYRDTIGPLDANTMSAAQTLADVASAYLLNAQARADLQASSDSARESDAKHRRLAEQLAAAQHVAEVGSWEWDMVADDVEWSDALYNLFGVEPTHVVATYQGYLLHIHPEDRRQAESAIQGALRTGDDFAFDHRVVRPDGTVAWIHSRGQVDRDDRGMPSNMHGTAIDITDRVALQHELAEFALFDELTGLHNRRGFITLADHLLKVASGAGRAVPLLFLDMNGMKTINDSYGHYEGDRALVEVATFLRATVRSSDLVARVGGDEFCILMAGDTTPSGLSVDRVVTDLRQGPLGDHSYTATLSVGVAWLEPGSDISVEELMHRADAAMYVDKESSPGRTRVLMVEDDADFRDLGKLALRGRYDIVTAADGGTALEMATLQVPDLVLLDLSLPDMPGAEVLRRLRSLPGGDRLPVIVITGATRENAELDCLQQGAKDFITKPFDFDVLDARMKIVLRRSSTRCSDS